MPSPWHWREARHALRRGGVIAYPTEGVWGLGCDPLDEEACDWLLRIKQRSWDKGLILVAADFAQLEPYVLLPSNAAYKRAAVTWPGPATWVFPCSDLTPDWISGDRDSVAVRVSAHPLVRELCVRFGGALVSTSANRSRQPPALSAFQVRQRFGDALDFVLPGALGGFPGSTPIRDASTGHILRR
jgi:L-threonylcarbamoyladenylate synthase